MGKRSNFERVSRDLYDTPKPAVAPLLPYLAPGTEFAEPCAGHGFLIDHLTAEGHHCVWATDINPQREDIGTLNAMTLPRLGRRNVRAQVVVTNPPWTRSILHPLIDRLSAVWPCWLLFDADWPHTRQSSDLILRCSRIVPIGRVKWMPGTKHVGKDNCCWYEFLPGHETGPQFVPRVSVANHIPHYTFMGPDERRRAEIVVAGKIADPGPLFAAGGKVHAETTEPRPVPVVRAPDAPRDGADASDAGSLAGAEIAGRSSDGAGVHPVQPDSGVDGRGDVGGVHGSASAMVAKLRSRLQPMVLPRISAREVE